MVRPNDRGEDKPLPPLPPGYERVEESFASIMVAGWGKGWMWNLPRDMRKDLRTVFYAGVQCKLATLMSALTDVFDSGQCPELFQAMKAWQEELNRFRQKLLEDSKREGK